MSPAIPDSTDGPDGPESSRRVANIRARLSALGRPDVRIIAVSKTHGPERISEMLAAGIRDFGENRQNEARDKFPLVSLAGLPPDARPIYHHIGPLQSGSARGMPGLFQYVHGVSALGAGSPLETLMKAAERKLQGPDESITYLIQVRLTDEKTKAGGMAAAEIQNLNIFPGNERVRFGGFMTMGPENQDPVQTREVFHELRELRNRIAPGAELSMGMSGDWELAVAEGATMIRIGTALFGSRGPGPWVAQPNT